MPTFHDLPFDVILDVILPNLSIKEIGAMSMVNTIWRDICNYNEIWKVLYLRTIRVKVGDHSIHIGPPGCWLRCRNYKAEQEHLIATGIHERIYKQINTAVQSRQCGYNVMDASKFFDKSWYGKCVPTELRQQLRPWSEIRTDGVAGNEFPVAPAPAASDSTSRKTWRASVLSARGPYCEYVNKEWREYNKSKGLSTVNLCQCPNHYVFESLGVPGACRNFKSYKKIVLKKLGTQSKHSDKKNAKRLTGAQDNLRCWRNIVSRDILVYDNAVRSATASAQELLRQKSDIESHRLCVHRSHGRLSDIYSRHAQNKSLCEKINHAIEEIK